jgi:hypothetical protein
MALTWSESLTEIRAENRDAFAAIAEDLAGREDECVRAFFMPLLEGRKERAVLLREEGEWITATLMGWIDGFFVSWTDTQLHEHLRRAGRSIRDQELDPRGPIIAMQGLRALAMGASERLEFGAPVNEAIQKACLFAQHEIQSAAKDSKIAPPDDLRWKASVDDFVRITRMNRVTLEKDLR